MKIETKDLQIDANNLTFDNVEVTVDTGENLLDMHDNMDVPQYLNHMLLNSIKMGSSDIHFEPYADTFRIRFRIDGVMQEITEIPRGFGHLISTRLKVIAGLDISEQRRAQSGRFKMQLTPEKGLDFRCSLIPTLHGETINLRLLYLPEEILEFEMLGLEEQQIIPLENAINKLQGMILVTGPTGSGKTVTLYTLIKHINSRPRNIYTVEDPIEIDLIGVNQINVAERIDFAEAARTIMRQDPDVIMLGEMRDAETIDTAIKAAHTGHLVLSTLHANTAPKAVPRLRNLGVAAYDISSIVTMVVSQRLLRRLAPGHREEIKVPHERLLALGFKEEEIDKLTLYAPKPGAENDGYRGRIGIFQVMSVNQELAQLIADGANDVQIDHYLTQQGVQDMRRSALNKVKNGLTDIHEVERVLGYEDENYAVKEKLTAKQVNQSKLMQQEEVYVQ